MKSRLRRDCLVLSLLAAADRAISAGAAGLSATSSRATTSIIPTTRTEWWYYTGNLKAADGHRFGFELTFFRQGVHRDQSTPRSEAGAGD